MRRRILLAILVLTGMSAAASAVPSAEAATPCWRRVVDDWFDGGVDRRYAPHCYSDALEHLPPDARAYTTAAGDIERAMLAAIRSYRTTAKAPARAAPTRVLESRARPKQVRMIQSSTPAPDETPFARAAAVGTSKNAATVPLPILVLGVVLGLLLAAAGTSRLARAALTRFHSS
jgi:hypothetical protein